MHEFAGEYGVDDFGQIVMATPSSLVALGLYSGVQAAVSVL